MHPTTPLSPAFHEALSRAPTMSQLEPGVSTSDQLPTPQQVNTLEQLQTPQQVELLDKIDELRHQGLSNFGIGLPQLIVCGDQSSGKSSLLEGLTRLRFPSKEGKCTNFATEVVLRREAKTEIVCTITSSAKRSLAQQRDIAKFKRVFSTREDFSFPTVIAEASSQLEFGVKAEEIAFYEDVLCIKYSGPELPSLTIVDLPGLFVGQLNGGSGAEKVADLVRSYMQDERSIILAVVSAISDAELQQVFQFVIELDPSRSRTLGIITKPDKIDRGGEDEKQIIMLARNENFPLKHGFHAVRNRSFSTKEHTDLQRDETEKDFFASGAWSAISREDVGIATLRIKLSRMLLDHISKELPSLVEAVQQAISSTETSLTALGGSRNTSRQQRGYLTGHAEKFQMLTNDALRGIYTNNNFFKLSSEDERTPTRLRNEIQNLNIAFASIMYRKGHTWAILNDPTHMALNTDLASSSLVSVQDYDAHFYEPTPVTRTEFLSNHIGKHVRRSRPSGLPSLVNPWVIGEVFQQQSQMWGSIAKHHLACVFDAVKVYIAHTLRFLMDTRTCSMVMLKQITPELDTRREHVEAKLKELLVPYTEQDPITYDPGFIAEIKAMRERRQAFSQSEGKNSFGPPTVLAHKSVGSQLLTESLDDFTNSEILDLMQTYYKRAITVFINNIAVLAIENCLIKNLCSIFSPTLIANLSDEALQAIAAESEKMRQDRDSLQQKLSTLKNGKAVLHEHMAMRPSVTLENSISFSSRMSVKDQRPRTPPPRQQNIDIPVTPQPEDVDCLVSNLRKLSVTPPSSRSRKSSRAREDSAVGLRQEKSRINSPFGLGSRNTGMRKGANETSDEEL